MYRITRRMDVFRVWFPEDLAGVLAGVAMLAQDMPPAERRGAAKTLAALCPLLGLRIVAEPHSEQAITHG